jgi:DNA-binding NarL/FixJ family response regulator
MKVTVFLADDHAIVREGLKALLAAEPDFALVGESGDGQETLRLVEKTRPQVLVMDLMMPGLNGLEAARQLKRRAPATRIVILSMHSDEAYVVEALRAGATAYVVKEAGSDQLLQAIRQAAIGRQYLSPPLSQEKIRSYLQKSAESPAGPLATLTPREREVLQLTAEGHSSNQISKRLFISPRTVESHRANLMRKLGVRNLKQLIRFALQHSLLPLPVP